MCWSVVRGMPKQQGMCWQEINAGILQLWGLSLAVWLQCSNMVIYPGLLRLQFLIGCRNGKWSKSGGGEDQHGYISYPSQYTLRTDSIPPTSELGLLSWESDTAVSAWPVWLALCLSAALVEWRSCSRRSRTVAPSWSVWRSEGVRGEERGSERVSVGERVGSEGMRMEGRGGCEGLKMYMCEFNLGGWGHVHVGRCGGMRVCGREEWGDVGCRNYMTHFVWWVSWSWCLAWQSLSVEGEEGGGRGGRGEGGLHFHISRWSTENLQVLLSLAGWLHLPNMRLACMI